uniref:Uncharacterized protein n=1 Tax=Pyricularia oryzae (strain P131) TaxID=1143193 RepID=L7JK84_PYRO1
MDKKDDEIVDLRARVQAANKPVMRVSRDELLASGGLFAERIPSFLAEIEKANRAAQQGSSTPAATDASSSSGFELGENEAKNQVHVEMDIVAGILEEKQPVTHTRPPGAEDGSDDEDDDEFKLAMPPAGTVTGAGDGRKPLKIRSARSSVSSEDSSSSDSSSSGGSPGRIARIILETPMSRAAPDAAGRADSASSTTSSSGSSTSGGSRDAVGEDSAQALSPSPKNTLEARKRTQSPTGASPVVDRILGPSAPAAVEDPPKKKKRTKKLIEEVE